MAPSHLLFESSAGYLLLKCKNIEEIGNKSKALVVLFVTLCEYSC